MHRLRRLLFWQAQFDARRPAVWLAGACYLLVAGPMLLWMLSLAGGFRRAPVSGGQYLTALTILHALVAVLVTTIRGARTADERATGFLALVQITDVPPFEWTCFRLLAALQAYLPLWFLRMPLYTVCLFMGRVEPVDFVMAELLLAVVFLLSATVSMCVSLRAQSTQIALMLAGGVVLGGQLLFYVPRLFLNSLRLAIGDFSGGLQTASEAALVFSQSSLIPHLWNRPSMSGSLFDAAPAMVMHLALSALFFLIAWLTAFSGVDVEGGGRGKPAAFRPPRRVWDDALAWQSFYIHANGQRTIVQKLIVFGLFTLCAAAAGYVVPGFVMAMVAVLTSLTLLIAAAHMGESVMRETRDQTLSTLALLPLDPMEIYHGWKRGVRRLTVVDHCFAAAMIPIAILLAGKALPAYLGLLLVLLLAPAFFFLNGIVRFEWAVFWLAAKVFPAMFIALFSSLYIALEWKHPWAGLALFATVALATHRYIVSQIPRQFLRQIEKIS
jgi:hypothetical protein